MTTLETTSGVILECKKHYKWNTLNLTPETWEYSWHKCTLKNAAVLTSSKAGRITSALAHSGCITSQLICNVINVMTVVLSPSPLIPLISLMENQYLKQIRVDNLDIQYKML